MVAVGSETDEDMSMRSRLFPGAVESCTKYTVEELEQRLCLSAVGNPNAANGWDASSAITVTASSTHASFYLPSYTVRGNNNTINPNIFDSTGQFVQGPRPTVGAKDRGIGATA